MDRLCSIRQSPLRSRRPAWRLVRNRQADATDRDIGERRIARQPSKAVSFVVCAAGPTDTDRGGAPQLMRGQLRMPSALPSSQTADSAGRARQDLPPGPFACIVRTPYASVSNHVARHRPVRLVLPAPVRTARSGLHATAQPRPDGLDAHRPGRPGARFPQTGRVFRRARCRRGRLDRHRRLFAECGGLAQAVRRQAVVAVGGAPASSGHPSGACARRQDLPAAVACRALRLSPAVGGAVQTQGADQPVHPTRAIGTCGGSSDRCLRACGATGPRRRLRRRGGDGIGRLSDQRIHRRAHQPAQRCLGWRCGQAHALCGGDRASHPRGLRAGLHHHLPAVAGGPGRRRQPVAGHPDAGTGDRGGGRDHHQFRYRLARGTHPDHRHLGTARGICRCDRQAQAAPAHSGGGDQPHQHARSGRAHPGRRRGRHGVAGAPAAGRPAVGQQGPHRPVARHQYLHRLQSGLPGSCVRQQAGELPGQPARSARNRTDLRTDPQPQAHCGGRCRPGRPGLRDGGRRARSPRHLVRCKRCNRRAIQCRQAHPGQGRIQ